MATCTICGVSFAKPEQVRGHIQGSGGEHAGIGFIEADEYISEARDESTPATDPDGDPDGDPADESLSPDGGVGVPDYGQNQPDEQADEHECPHCEENDDYFDASKAGYDYGCPDCSTPENWVVWNA